MAKNKNTNTVSTTDMWVTPLGMGCATIGDLFEVISERQSLDTIKASYDAGVRFFDTSPWYGLGKSELRLGAGLRVLPRDDISVATKVGRVLGGTDNLDWRQVWKGGIDQGGRFDYTHDGVMRSFEDSLQRLGMTRIDGLAIHDLDKGYHGSGLDDRIDELDRGGGYRALRELKTSGSVKAIGAGVNETGMIPRLLERFDIDYFLVAMPYTLLDQSGLSDLDLCHARGISVIIGAPYASGLLASGTARPSTYNYAPSPKNMLEKTSPIETVCHDYNVSLPAAALQFVLMHPAVVSVIPGPNTPRQAEMNAVYARETIPQDFWNALAQEGLISAI
jgi:D-threo-aldose 1-dehydrogenase